MPSHVRVFATLAIGLASCGEARAPSSPIAGTSGVASADASAAASASAAPADGPPLPFPRGPLAGECTGAKCFESRTGFRALHPLPVLATLEAVVAIDRNEALIVGDRATVLRVRGDAVARVEIPNLRSAATTFAELDNVPETKVHETFRGSQFWRTRLESVVRTTPEELLVLVDGKSIARFDGARWATEAPPAAVDFGDLMFGDAVSGPVVIPSLISSLWSDAKPLLRTPGGWTRGGKLPPKMPIRSGVARGDTVWLGGDEGTILRSKAGAAFQAEPLSPPSTQDVTALWVSRDGRNGLAVTRANEAYERDERGVWHGVDPIADLKERAGDIEAFWSTPDDKEIWAVGDRVFRRKGNGAWRKVDVPAWAEGPKGLHIFEGDRFHAIDGTAADDVWVVGRFGAIFHWNGTSFREVSRRHLDEDIVAIHPLEGNGWLAFGTEGTILRGNGAGEVVKDSRIDRGIGSVVRAADGALIVINHGDETLVREAAGWASRPRMKGLYSADGAASESVFYSLGWDGRAERVTAQGRTKVVHGVKEDLREIAFAGPRDAWIIGDGIILRGDGASFSVLARHPHDDYRAISIRAPNDVWIAGDARDIGSAGLVLHWDGKKLHRYEGIHSSAFRAIHAAPGAVWAVGISGAAAWFDGTKWQLADTLGADLEAVWVTPDGTVIAGGDGGAIVALAPPGTK